MNQVRRTHIDRLPYRVHREFIEPKKDRYGRIAFKMPEVRSLSALEISMNDGLLKAREKHVHREVEPVKVVF